MITAAGNDERGAGLVYIAALAPDAGESTVETLGKCAAVPAAASFLIAAMFRQKAASTTEAAFSFYSFDVRLKAGRV